MSTVSDLDQSLGRRIMAHGHRVDTKNWQSLDVSERPEMTPIELIAVNLSIQMPQSVSAMQTTVKPNLPWVEEHFLERVSGEPLNPPPSHEHWPHARASNAEHVDEQGKFSHTYPERFWPKRAGRVWYEGIPIGKSFKVEAAQCRRGVRYDYGDLNDVVQLMLRDPYTRQAYLPVFFPEDTGQHHGQRIPCTLGYQFLIRQGQMHIIYGIRSCDFLRHWKDDVYMAMRLAHWMLTELYRRGGDITPIDKQITLGTFYMNIGSLHVFEGDMQLMKLRYK